MSSKTRKNAALYKCNQCGKNQKNAESLEEHKRSKFLCHRITREDYNELCKFRDIIIYGEKRSAICIELEYKQKLHEQEFRSERKYKELERSIRMQLRDEREKVRNEMQKKINSKEDEYERMRSEYYIMKRELTLCKTELKYKDKELEMEQDRVIALIESSNILINNFENGVKKSSELFVPDLNQLLPPHLLVGLMRDGESAVRVPISTNDLEDISDDVD